MPASMASMPLRQIRRIERRHGGLYGERRGDGIAGIARATQRRAEQRHDRIVRVLVHHAVMPFDHLGDLAQVTIKQRQHSLERLVLALGGEALDVSEQHRDHPLFAAQRDGLAHQLLGDLVRHHLAEQVAHFRFLGQPGRHRVDGAGQLADLILPGHRNGLPVVPGLDAAHARRPIEDGPRDRARQQDHGQQADGDHREVKLQQRAVLAITQSHTQGIGHGRVCLLQLRAKQLLVVRTERRGDHVHIGQGLRG